MLDIGLCVNSERFIPLRLRTAQEEFYEVERKAFVFF